MFRGDAAHSGVYRGTAAGFAGVAWSFDAGGAVRGSPTVVDDVLYVGSTAGTFHALNAGDGTEVWHYDGGASVNSTAAVRGDMVYYGDRANTLRALDRRDGSIRWALATGPDMPLPWGKEGWDYFTSSPTVAGDLVLFGSGDGTLYAVDARSGDEVWRHPTEGRIRSTPAVSGDTVYVGSADGSLYAVSLTTGDRIWRFRTRGADLSSEEHGFDRRTIQSSPVVAGGRVVFGARDGFMYSLDAGTGKAMWDFDHQVSWCVTSPAAEGGDIYSASSDGLFAHAVDAATGEERWRVDLGARVFASPAVVGTTVLVADHDGLLRALDRSTGDERWRFRTDGPIQSSPVVVGGITFVGSDDGFVYALRTTDGPSFQRAVHWDADLQPLLAIHEDLRDHLASSGYNVLDSEAALAFMEDRTSDGEPSALVFAQGRLPAGMGVPSDTVLLRRYLDAGGRVVWAGYPPFSLVFNDTGQIVALDMVRAGQVLGVDHGNATGDEYATWATETGTRWGLQSRGIDILGVDPADVSESLAVDERGRATSWVRRYSNARLGGFVRIGGMLSAGTERTVRRAADYAGT